MKKILLMVTALLMVACGGEKKENDNNEVPQNRVLVLYYSQTGDKEDYKVYPVSLFISEFVIECGNSKDHDDTYAPSHKYVSGIMYTCHYSGHSNKKRKNNCQNRKYPLSHAISK